MIRRALAFVLAALCAFIVIDFGFSPADALTQGQRAVLFSGQCSKLNPSCITGYTYYVNSVTGNNSNTGQSFVSPLADLTSVPTLNAGQSVCLEAGSTWRELLQIAAASAIPGVTIAGCGTSALPSGGGAASNAPIINASDVMSSGNWTKTGGLTVTYNTTTPVAFPGTLISVPWVEVFENGNYLSYQTSQANVDATAGSYTVDSMTGATGTIYIHASDGSNPASNGKTYEYTSRSLGLGLNSSGGALVANIHFERTGSYNGSLQINGDGSNPTVANVTMDQGNRHSLLMASGNCNNCLFNDIYSPTQQAGGNQLVFFETVGSGVKSYCNNCVFNYGSTMSLADSTNQSTAATAHSGSGTFGDTIFNNATIIATINSGHFTGLGASGGNAIISGGTFIDVEAPMFTASPFTTTASGFKYKTTLLTAGELSVLVPGATLNISNANICMIDVNQGVIRHTSAGASTLAISGVTFYAQPTQNSTVSLIFDTGGSLTWSVNNSVIDETQHGGSWSWNGNATGETYTGDNNQFPGVAKWALNNTTETTLPTWQAFSSQDSHSVTTGSGSSACN